MIETFLLLTFCNLLHFGVGWAVGFYQGCRYEEPQND